MSRYIFKRLLLMIPTLFGVAVLVFFMLRVAPGDVVELKYAGSGTFAPREAIERERAQLGLDKPLWQQFAVWTWGIVRFDFGTSMWTGRAIADEIKIRLELSLQLALMATLVAVLIAIPFGTLAALKQDTWIDYLVRIFAIGGLAMPSFWLGIVMILGFLLRLQMDAAADLHVIFHRSLGQFDPALLARAGGGLPLLGHGHAHDPLRGFGSFARGLRAHSARQGLWERAVVVKHALRNALLPIVTVIGLEFAFLIGGLVVTEQVFNLNGIGMLFVESISRRDYTMTQALVLLVSFAFIFMNLLIDLLYAWLDPRIRYQ